MWGIAYSRKGLTRASIQISKAPHFFVYAFDYISVPDRKIIIMKEDLIKRSALNKLIEIVRFELKRLVDCNLSLKSFDLKWDGIFTEEEYKEIKFILKKLRSPGYVSFYCYFQGIDSQVVDDYLGKQK